jgi:RimJ/RimL family protein N-acetyltransferase
MYNLKGSTVMGFGPIMDISHSEYTIRLAPLSRNDLAEFVRDGAMQSSLVKKYLGSQMSQVLEDEQAWYEKTRTDKTSWTWGVFVQEGEDWRVIGTTSLHLVEHDYFKIAVSGIVIIRPEWWGKGIASACHKARTWYAFTQLGLHQIRSAVYAPNEASMQALLKVGYLPVFTERNELFVDSTFVDKVSLAVINPLEPMWTAWWHGDPIPKADRVARGTTRVALKWSEKNVRFV